MKLRIPSLCFFLLLFLSACRGISPTAVAESTTVIPATMPPSPQPSPTFTPALTPTTTPTPLPPWKAVEIAIAQALSDTPDALCEWVPFAHRDGEVYNDAICFTEISGSAGEVILFLGPDGEIQNSGSVGPKEFGGIVESLDLELMKQSSQKGMTREQMEVAEKHIQQRWQDGSPPFIAILGEGWPDIIAKRPTPGPTAPPLMEWMTYESAITAAYQIPRALCEWIIIAQRDQKVYLDVYCENDSSSVTGPMIIYLKTPTEGVWGAWAPPAGDEGAALEKLGPELYDLYLERRMGPEMIEAAEKHIEQRRQDGSPPLIVLSGVELP